MNLISKDVYIRIKELAKEGVVYSVIADEFNISVAKVIEVASPRYERYYDVISKGCDVDMLCIKYGASRTLACRIMRSYNLHRLYVLGCPESEVLRKPSDRVTKIINMVKNNMDMITITKDCYCKPYRVKGVISQYKSTLLKGYDTSRMLSIKDVQLAYEANDMYNRIKNDGDENKKVNVDNISKNVKMTKDIADILKCSNIFKKYMGIIDESKRELIRSILIDIANNVDFISVCRRHKVTHSYLKLIFNKHKKMLMSKFDVSRFLYPEDIEIAYLFNNVYTTYRYKRRKLTSYEVASVNGNRRIIEILNLSKKHGILISGRSN